MKDPMQAVQLALAYGAIHFAANWWQENTLSGMMFRDFCRTWKTDSLLHLILCGGTVFLFGCCGIVGLALFLRALGI